MPKAVKKSITKAKRTIVEASGLNLIDKKRQEVGRDPNLTAELNRMASANDVGAAVALFDAYERAAEAISAIENQPRSAAALEFLEVEQSQLWAKAYAVADKLKTMRPSNFERERFVEALFRCALMMGCEIEDATSVLLGALAVGELPEEQAARSA